MKSFRSNTHWPPISRRRSTALADKAALLPSPSGLPHPAQLSAALEVRNVLLVAPPEARCQLHLAPEAARPLLTEHSARLLARKQQQRPQLPMARRQLA